jgi:hypothetical protein
MCPSLGVPMTSRGGLERLQQYFICFGISNLLLSFLLVVNLEMKQIIVKEKGIFTNVTSPTTKAKLRLLFEVAPFRSTN